MASPDDREFAPEPIQAESPEEIPDRPLQGLPSDDDDESVWRQRQPERRFRLPMGFDWSGTWVREIEIRPMDGASEDLMGDTSGTFTDHHKRMTEVLSRCTVRAGDGETWTERPSNATKDRTGTPDPTFFSGMYDKMPMPNRILVIIRLRQLTVHLPEHGISGHEYEFSDNCPYCKKYLSPLTTRLDTLPITYVEDTWCRETRHVEEIGEYKIEWKTPIGSDETKIEKIQTERKSDLFSGMLFVSVLTINGKQPRTFDDMKALPQPVRNMLRNRMDKGGMDIAIKIQCPKCEYEYRRQLPWRQKGFFFPSERS